MSDKCPHCGAILIPGQPLCTECGNSAGSGAPRQGLRPPAGAGSTAPAARLPRRDKQKDYSLVGKTVAGKYEILEVLGQGGFGTVYLVEITAGMVGEKLAMKILPEELSAQPTFRNQFLNEIRVAMRVVDKYIAQIRDVGATEDGLLYYTMDLCAGLTLAQVLRDERKLPITRTLLIVMSVLRGVQTAHASGIIHRDLKPANIMVQAQGGKDTVRILDFGIAMAIQTGERQKGFAGSPHYMPPEQFVGEQIGFYTDIYAIGVILYECITGERPHPGSTPQEVFKSLKTRVPPPIHTLVPEAASYPGLSELVTKAIEKNPERRFQSARELFDAVNAVVTRATAPAIAAPPGARATFAGAASPAFPGTAPAGSNAPRGAPRRVRKRRLSAAGRSSGSRAGAVAIAMFIVATTVAVVVFNKEISRWWNEGVQVQPPPTSVPAPAPREKPLTAAKKAETSAAKKGAPGGLETTPGEEMAAAGANLTAQAGKLVEECEKALKQEAWSTATERADTLLGLDPQSLEGHRLRGLAAHGLRDFKSAATSLEKARSLAAAKNGGELDPSLLSALAEAKMNLTPPALPEAETLLKEALRKAPRDGETIARFARLLDMEVKRPDAKKVLQAARQGRIDSPAVEELWQKLTVEDALKLAADAQDAYEKADFLTAVELATKSRDLTPTTAADLAAADSLVEMHHLEEAIKVLEETLERKTGPPVSAPSDDDVARIEGRLGCLKALRTLAAEKADPSEEDFQTASAEFEKAVQKFPKGSDAKQQLRLQTLRSFAIAKVHAERGDAAGVGSALQELQKDPIPMVLAEVARIHILLARNAASKEAKAQAYGLAKKELQTLLRTKELSDELRRQGNYLLGTAQLASGDLEKNEGAYSLAISSFAAAEKAGLKTQELYESWAEAYDRTGNLIKAAQLFRNVYEIEPSPETCLRAVEHYLNANPKSPEALDLIQQGKDRFKSSKEIQRKYEELTR